MSSITPSQFLCNLITSSPHPPPSQFQFNVGRVMDRTLASITLADCMKFLGESMNNNVKPFVDGWGKFSLRNLLIEMNRRNQELLANVQNQGAAVISNVQNKGQEIIKTAQIKRQEIITNVQDRGEELLATKKKLITDAHNRGQAVISNIQNTGEKIIGGVVDGAKKTIAGLTPPVVIGLHKKNKPLYDEVNVIVPEEQQHESTGFVFSRRKRDTEDLEAIPDPLEGEGRFQDLELLLDTKMATNEVDAHDAPASSSAYIKSNSIYTPTSPKPVVVVVPPHQEEPEYYTLPELTDLFIKWVRTNFTFRRRLWPAAAVTSA